MGHTKSFSVAQVDDDFEFDESYFRQFYKPLSNLPTPPPSTRASSANQSPRVSLDDTEGPNSQYLGPAAHLARMLPPGASFITPSIPTVQQMLASANLPMDIIALAVCILDSLDSKFSRSWRISFPLHSTNQDQLQQQQQQSPSKRHTLPSALSRQQATHINSVFPEIIILAALVVAEKFVEDMQSPTQYFISTWARDAWTCEQLNFTERCIMESLGYRILPLWDPALIKQARHDIEMARREIIQETCAMGGEDGGAARKQHHFKSMSSGHAIMGLGLHLTPAATPDTERVPSFD